MQCDVCVMHLTLSAGASAERFAVDAAESLCCLNHGDRIEQRFGGQERAVFGFLSGIPGREPTAVW